MTRFALGLTFATILQIICLNDHIRAAIWRHSALAMLLTLLMGCSSDANSHQAIEHETSDPNIGSGGWSYPNRSWSTGRAIGNDAGAGPLADGTAGRGGFSSADTASMAGTAILPGASSSTKGTPLGIGGATAATGGQPTTVPTNTVAAATSGASSVASAGTTSASGTYGGSVGTAGTSTIGGAPSTGGASSTRVFPVEIGSDTPVRVLFDSVAGTSTDTSVQVMVRLENRSTTEAFPLKDIEVTYWATMTPIKSIACICDSPICNSATVGTFRSSHGQANCGFIYRFPGFELQPGKTIVLSWNCHYTDWTAIDESDDYSYPFGMTAGEEMARVTVIDKAQQKLLWGVLPE